MKATIEINNLCVRSHHGVLPQENITGNTFEVTVHLRYPIDDAIVNDNIESTLNYTEVVEQIKAEMKKPSQLLEHVAGRIRSTLVSRFPKIQGGMIRIAKITPPISAQMQSVAITIKW